MSTSGSRWWLVVAAMFAALLTLAGIVEFAGIPRLYGVWGCIFGAGTQPFNVRVTSVDKTGPAQEAGIEPGDTLDLRNYGLSERMAILQQPIAGRPIRLTLERSGRIVRTSVTPVTTRQRTTVTSHVYFFSTRTYDAGLFLMSLFALLIAWRRPERRDARVLSLMLTAFVVGEMASPQNVVVPWPWLAVVLEYLSQIAYVAPIALFAAFASLAAPPRSSGRTGALLFTYVLVGASLLIGLGIAVGQTLLWIDPVGLYYQPLWTLPQSAAYVVALVCGVLAFASARGAERQLVGWATASVGVLFLSQIAATLGEEYATTYSGYVGYEVVGNTGVFLAPIGLSYALLNRRLLDIGFVLNRAAVFTAVSIIIVGLFFVVEWALNEWIRDASHLTGVVVNVGLALVLGFSIRAIHTRVDRAVDKMFFRKRYEDEQALRDFAHEAAFISNAGVLARRAVDEVMEHAQAASATIVLADDVGVDPDDEVMVALRAFHKPVELRKYRTSLRGEYAFPMSGRGRLVGAFVCGPKRGGESYAPDEFDAITQLALAVGAALDALAPKDQSTLGALLATQREILKVLNTIQGTLLPREVL